VKTFEELKLDSLSEEELLTEISLGKISTTVVLGKILVNLKKIKDDGLRDVLRFMTYMIYVTSLQHKKKKEG
jgi:hypothetical protein